MNHLFLIIIIAKLTILSNCNNIILPFSKLTIGYFSGHTSIDDLISYNIFTNISIGTPPQSVAHFIDPTDYSLHFKKRLITYGNNKFSPFLRQYESLDNFWFNEKKSSTFKKYNNSNFFSDVYYFKNLKNEEVKSENVKYTILDSHFTDAYKCGNIGLNNPAQFDFKLNKNEAFLIHELKMNGLVDEYTFSIIYDDKNSLLDYKYDINYGTVIIGESPHVYNPNKYKKENLVINQSKDWAILINTVKFNSSKGDFIQENIEMQINFIHGFIKGTESYRLKVEEIFFNELIKENLCKVEVFTDNIYLSNYDVFSCENSFEIREHIKSFPILYFELNNDLEFIFTYEDLFKVFNDTLYFMIIFRSEKGTVFAPRWVMGEIFLRKYLTVFNYETKEISFYKNLVEQINIDSENSYFYSFSLIKLLKIIGGVIIGLIIIWILFLLYRKYIKSKKVNATELEKSNSLDEKNKKHILLEENKSE